MKRSLAPSNRRRALHSNICSDSPASALVSPQTQTTSIQKTSATQSLVNFRGKDDVENDQQGSKILQEPETGALNQPDTLLCPPRKPGLKRKFTCPTRSVLQSTTSTTSSIQKCSPTQDSDGEKILFVKSVMFCKQSNKKHKTYDDGILVATVGGLSTLKDMEGKDISKTRSYRLNTLQGLVEGSTLYFGQKEIEICGSISEEDYSSGRIFISQRPAIVETQITASAGARAPFKKRKFQPVVAGQTESVIKLKPLYDPMAPDALVLSHAFTDSTVSVVVDPYLSQLLRPHQRDGVKFLYERVMSTSGNTGCILADEMGLGKTLQCITLLWTLLKQGPLGHPGIRRALVVTPSSLTKNWKSEFLKWLKSTRIQPYCVGDHKQKAADIIRDWSNAPVVRSVLIISYEQFRQHAALFKDISVGVVICDEGHRLKNSSSKITKALKKIKCEKRVILSGTPIQNDLEEFHTMCVFVNPGCLGDIPAFKQVYINPINRGREPNASEEEVRIARARSAELLRLTRPFILRRTSDILEKYLPEKIENVVFCSMSALQHSMYEAYLRSSNIYNILNGNMSSALEAIAALRLLCNHPLHACKQVGEAIAGRPQYNNLKKEIEALASSEAFDVEASGKMLVLKSILSQIRRTGNNRVVLVSLYKKTLDLLEKMCLQEDFSFCRLDGSTPQGRRQEIVDNFNQDNKTFLFLLSSKAGGVGLNLIGANVLIMVECDWNPATDHQAMARVWRDGQKKVVKIYRLLCTGTIDEKIYQRQIAKIGLSKQMIDNESSDASRMSFSQEELKDIFTVNNSTLCDTHDLVRCGCRGGKGKEGELDTVAVLPSRGTEKTAAAVTSQIARMKHLCSDYGDPHLEATQRNITYLFRLSTLDAPTDVSDDIPEELFVSVDNGTGRGDGEALEATESGNLSQPDGRKQGRRRFVLSLENEEDGGEKDLEEEYDNRSQGRHSFNGTSEREDKSSKSTCSGVSDSSVSSFFDLSAEDFDL